MQSPALLGYSPETVVAEKLEAVVKLALVNTRLKDFYDLWVICRKGGLDRQLLQEAIKEVFKNRGTKRIYPVSFTPAFYEDPKTLQRWRTFLAAMGQQQLEFKDVVLTIAKDLAPFIENL